MSQQQGAGNYWEAYTSRETSVQPYAAAYAPPAPAAAPMAAPPRPTAPKQSDACVRAAWGASSAAKGRPAPAIPSRPTSAFPPHAAWGHGQAATLTGSYTDLRSATAAATRGRATPTSTPTSQDEDTHHVSDTAGLAPAAGVAAGVVAASHDGEPPSADRAVAGVAVDPVAGHTRLAATLAQTLGSQGLVGPDTCPGSSASHASGPGHASLDARSKWADTRAWSSTARHHSFPQQAPATARLASSQPDEISSLLESPSPSLLPPVLPGSSSCSPIELPDDATDPPTLQTSNPSSEAAVTLRVRGRPFQRPRLERHASLPAEGDTLSAAAAAAAGSGASPVHSDAFGRSAAGELLDAGAHGEAAVGPSAGRMPNAAGHERAWMRNHDVAQYWAPGNRGAGRAAWQQPGAAGRGRHTAPARDPDLQASDPLEDDMFEEVPDVPPQPQSKQRQQQQQQQQQKQKQGDPASPPLSPHRHRQWRQHCPNQQHGDQADLGHDYSGLVGEPDTQQRLHVQHQAHQAHPLHQQQPQLQPQQQQQQRGSKRGPPAPPQPPQPQQQPKQHQQQHPIIRASRRVIIEDDEEDCIMDNSDDVCGDASEHITPPLPPNLSTLQRSTRCRDQQEEIFMSQHPGNDTSTGGPAVRAAGATGLGALPTDGVSTAAHQLDSASLRPSVLLSHAPPTLTLPGPHAPRTQLCGYAEQAPTAAQGVAVTGGEVACDVVCDSDPDTFEFETCTAAPPAACAPPQQHQQQQQSQQKKPSPHDCTPLDRKQHLDAGDGLGCLQVSEQKAQAADPERVEATQLEQSAPCLGRELRGHSNQPHGVHTLPLGGSSDNHSGPSVPEPAAIADSDCVWRGGLGGSSGSRKPLKNRTLDAWLGKRRAAAGVAVEHGTSSVARWGAVVERPPSHPPAKRAGSKKGAGAAAPRSASTPAVPSREWFPTAAAAAATAAAAAAAATSAAASGDATAPERNSGTLSPAAVAPAAAMSHPSAAMGPITGAAAAGAGAAPDDAAGVEGPRIDATIGPGVAESTALATASARQNSLDAFLSQVARADTARVQHVAAQQLAVARSAVRQNLRRRSSTKPSAAAKSGSKKGL
ncbi:MAG: hypothetical protein WDW38_005916 [Sanguina aurantia]